MKAQLKCSSCGAEISNLNFSWGKWQWLSMIPLLVFILFIPRIMRYGMEDRNDYRADLSIREVQKRFSDGELEILGLVQNSGQVPWKSIVIEAELFDADGNFMNELTCTVQAEVAPQGSEYFKLLAKNIPTTQWEATKDVKLKVADAWHSRF